MYLYFAVLSAGSFCGRRLDKKIETEMVNSFFAGTIRAPFFGQATVYDVDV